MTKKLNWYQSLVCKVLKQGKIPRHMAFIMDGNRRYAQKLGQQKLKGHQYGVKALQKCLLICSQLEIQIVTLYCFSIQNFKRSEQQVNKLMHLVVEVFQQYSPISQLFIQKNIKVNVIGDISKVKPQIRKIFNQVQQRTSSHTKMIINICFAYDSMYEVKHALQKVSLAEESYHQFWENLLIKQYVDVLVRTSNEHRLSNFLLVQSSYCQMNFLKQNWPQINIFSFIKILLEYNYNYESIQNIRKQVISKHKIKCQELIQNQ